MKALWWFLIPLALSAGCSAGQDAGDREPLTKRQRDSTIAETEELPGSGTVGRAMEIADSAAARRERGVPGSN
jgi:hypothetical protein